MRGGSGVCMGRGGIEDGGAGAGAAKERGTEPAGRTGSQTT